MILCRKRSPVLLLMVTVVIVFSLMYHLTLQLLLVKVKRDDPSRGILAQHEAINRIAERVIIQEFEGSESNSNSFQDYTQSGLEETFRESQEISTDQNDMEAFKKSMVDITQISSIRMSLIKDALAELSQMTKDIFINQTAHEMMTLNTDKETLCKYYTEQGRLERYSVPRVWSDTGYYNEEDVTFVTQITLNKLGTLKELLTHWAGPVSCSLYLDKNDMKLLPGFLSKFPTILQRENLDIHLSGKSGALYPINYLRNLALNYSYTAYVLLMDVDFMPSQNLFQYLMETIPKMRYLRQEVLVVPAMEFTSYAGTPFPKNKEELLELWALKIIATSGELHWPPSHKPTNYTLWRNATKPYHVDHVEGYEPYIVARRDILPRYNVSFLAGFRDKIVHILHVHASGMKFTVIPDHFAVHIPHSRESRPPFYPCSEILYKEFLNLLINAGTLKNESFVVKPAEEGPRPRRKIIRRIIRKVIRRKARRKLTPLPLGPDQLPAANAQPHMQIPEAKAIFAKKKL